MGGKAPTSSLFELADLILVDRNPGTTADAAAEATQLISSNFSRALRALEKKASCATMLIQKTPAAFACTRPTRRTETCNCCMNFSPGRVPVLVGRV